MIKTRTVRTQRPLVPATAASKGLGATSVGSGIVSGPLRAHWRLLGGRAKWRTTGINLSIAPDLQKGSPPPVSVADSVRNVAKR